MMILKQFPAHWLCLCLNLLFLNAMAQEPIAVEVIIGDAKPFQSAQDLSRFQAGVEVGRPVAFPLGLIRDWKAVLPLEGVIQYHMRSSPIYMQLYGGYFQGMQQYENRSELTQRAFYLKPGFLLVVKNSGIRHNFTLEGNLIMSFGNIKGENIFHGPIFGNYKAKATYPVESFGVETGVGADVLRLGSYKIKAQARIFMCSSPDADVLFIPGAGYVGFMGLGLGVNFYLMHAWGN